MVVALLAAGCGRREPADTRADYEREIRALVAEWSSAAEAKHAEHFATFYAADGVLMVPGAPAIRGREAIEAAVREMMAAPGFHLTFSSDKVEVARSGELAAESGTYQLTTNDAQGNPQTEIGKYVVVWKKQADGMWKVAYDIINADH
jgi:uncharacterized protein (TIGR02246 family)